MNQRLDPREIEVVNEPSGIPLIQVADYGECKWPVSSSGKEHMFCGLPTPSRTAVYCNKHRPRAWYKEKVNTERVKTPFLVRSRR